MPYRVQYTALPNTLVKRSVAGAALRQQLSRDMADSARTIIDMLRRYPGEGPASMKQYIHTGRLTLRTYRSLGATHAGASQSSRNDYVRTGLLGHSWGYDINDNIGGSMTLVITNSAYDRPGNYYGGWVNGWNPPGESKYHQTAWHADHGWVSFNDAMKLANIETKCQATINSYFREMGLL